MFLSFSSTAGDVLAHGATRRFEPPQATFFGGVFADNHGIAIIVRHDGTFSELSLRAMDFQVLTPGVYRTDSSLGGVRMFFAYNGSSCVDNSSEFEVLEAVYAGGKIDRFRATFRQRCNSTPNDSITGEVRVVSLPTTPTTAP